MTTIFNKAISVEQRVVFSTNAAGRITYLYFKWNRNPFFIYKKYNSKWIIALNIKLPNHLASRMITVRKLLAKHHNVVSKACVRVRETEVSELLYFLRAISLDKFFVLSKPLLFFPCIKQG